jgi:hypothetical protein
VHELMKMRMKASSDKAKRKHKTSSIEKVSRRRYKVDGYTHLS